MSRKNNQLTPEDIEFILDNMDTMSIETLSKALGKRPALISDYIENNTDVAPKKDKPENIRDIKQILRKRPYYASLKEQFLPHELKLFEYNYESLYEQFESNVFHTEEGQIVDLCKIDILLNRAYAAQNANNEEILELDDRIKRMGEFADPEEVGQLKQIRASLRAANPSLTKEIVELANRKQAMLKEIKGTRDQRISRIEDSKNTFGALMVKLLTNKEFCRNVGIEMEMKRLAAEKEYKRLGQEILYADGVYDRPLLNAETVFFDDEEEKENKKKNSRKKKEG